MTATGHSWLHRLADRYHISFCAVDESGRCAAPKSEDTHTLHRSILDLIVLLRWVREESWQARTEKFLLFFLPRAANSRKPLTTLFLKLRVIAVQHSGCTLVLLYVRYLSVSLTGTEM